jgi:ergothioneine biosynthesis protein EgtB
MLERSEINLIAAGDLAAAFKTVRDASMALAAPLSDEDCTAQSMPDASPVKWHLAHTTWFFETFLLESFEDNFAPFHNAFRVLFNSYYNGVGEKHPRPQRGLLTRPSRKDVVAYRENVDARMLRLLGQQIPPALAELVVLGLHHEQQHQELILTDVLHLLSVNPLFPAYDAAFPAPAAAGPLQWHAFDGGVVTIGLDEGATTFSFDNESPNHRQFLEPFTLASRLVTNAEFLQFVEQGGYSDAALWLAEGWDFIRTQNITQPLYWHKIDGVWHEFTPAGLTRLQNDSPALHLSYFEANAYALWAGARLPTEAEFEHAAGSVALEQCFDTAWQWTSTSYAPYPGFRTAAGALGEYNGKFMVNQYVLRGGSLATPEGHTRLSYRNFFGAGTRWQFSGIRLAK